MKKVLLTIAGVAALNAVCFSQLTVDFESHPLSPESFDNGATNGGDFNFGYLDFSNVYDDIWGSWTGFAISNTTDVTTPGYTNQYSAFTGSGNAGSANYATFYSYGSITAAGGGVIESFYVTNTTYAGISMRDGDAFAKQFGSLNNAEGNPDGTNGEDFFRMWVIGVSEAGARDSLEFYLADYRFPASNDDYIVDTWELIDLSQLNHPSKSVEFLLESSDNGQWGMNTPAYFSIDDVSYAMPLSTNSIGDTAIEIFPNPVKDKLTIQGVDGTAYILDLRGNVLVSEVVQGFAQIDFSSFATGTYLLRIESTQGTFVEKIVR